MRRGLLGGARDREDPQVPWVLSHERAPSSLLPMPCHPSAILRLPNCQVCPHAFTGTRAGAARRALVLLGLIQAVQGAGVTKMVNVTVHLAVAGGWTPRSPFPAMLTPCFVSLFILPVLLAACLLQAHRGNIAYHRMRNGKHRFLASFPLVFICIYLFFFLSVSTS